MTSQSTVEPLHRHLLTTCRTIALSATGGAFLITLLLVTTGQAQELNPVAEWAFGHIGWASVGVLALAGIAACFALYRHWLAAHPRVALSGAGLLAAVGILDLGRNLLVLSTTGLPETVYWSGYGTAAVIVAVATVVTLASEHVPWRSLSGSMRRHTPSSQTVGAVIFAVLLVGGIIGPFAGLDGQHNGIAAAQSGDGVEVDGTVYVGSNDGTLYAYDAATGSEEWSFSAANNIRSSPTVAGGTVYVGSDDNHVYAIDAETGAEEWNYSTGGQIAQASPTVVDGTVYIGSNDNNLYALDADTGAEQWTFSNGGSFRHSSPSVVNGTVYVGSGNDVMYALNASTGSQEWSFSEGENWGIRSSPTVTNGSVYFGSDESYIYSLNASDGSKEWSFATSNYAQSSPTVVDGTVYSADISGNLYAIEASTGTEEWSLTTSGFDYTSPTVAGGTLYIGSDDNNLYALDADTGSEEWNYSTGNAIPSSPTVIQNTVYVGSADNSLYAVDATTGASEWSSPTGGSVRSSPTVVPDGSSRGEGSRMYYGTLGHNSLKVTDGSEYSLGHPISGTVTDHAGNPVDGATVSTDSGISTTTGSDGSYELTVENTGTYDVTAETAIDEETQTVDVPDGGLTGVNFSLQSGTVAGVVEDQNGNPVADATVTTLTYNTKDPDVDVNLEELRDIVENPYPPQWTTFTDREGVGETDLPEGTSDIQTGNYEFNGTTVLMHESEAWGLNGVDWPVGDTKLLPNNEVEHLRIAVGAEERPAFSCWRPPTGFRDEAFEDPLGQDLEGLVNAQCENITIEKLDPTGGVTETTTISPQPEIRVRSPWSLGKGQLTTTYDVARPDLDSGFYRVYPDDNQGAAMTYAVAPNANPEAIKTRILNVTNSEIKAQSDYQKRIYELHNESKIDIKTTTTNDRGEFSFEIDESIVKEVELRAAKSGTGLETDLASGELNRQQLASDFEDTVRGELNTFDKSSLSLEEAEVGTQEFGDVCRQMGSVADDLGAPYTGSASTEVPNPDVTIQGQRAPIPEGVSQPVRECAVLNYAQAALEDPGSLLPGLAGDIADMAQDELEGHYENIVNLLKGNEDLQSVVEDELGRDLPEDPSELNPDEIETVIRDGLDEVDNPDSDIDVGDDQDDSPVPDIPGTGDGDAPSVDDPTEEISDRVNETITREWPITGVDDWAEAGLLIRIDYADGTSETLSRDSEYVTLEESTIGPDTIRLEEYPFGEGDAAVANIRLDVSTPQGIGGEETPVRNPTFDGTVPGLDSIRLSDSAPGPSDAVTVGVTPAEQSQFGQLQTVNVTGPECSRSIDASENQATFTTCGQGTHRVAATFTNADGTRFTEVLSVDVGNAAQARDPLIRGAAGPTGRFAVAANGLENGRIDVTAGTSEVILTGIVPADADIPNRVTASTTGVDVARDATTTVRIRQGSNEQTIRQRIGVVLHTAPVGNESLMWRNGRPIRNPGDTASSTVEHYNGSTTVDTFSSDTATVRVEVDRDPSFFDEFRHSVQLRLNGIDLPFLSMQPASWLTSLGSLGDGLPAPVHVGGGPLAVLAGGAAAARRVGP